MAAAQADIKIWESKIVGKYEKRSEESEWTMTGSPVKLNGFTGEILFSAEVTRLAMDNLHEKIRKKSEEVLNELLECFVLQFL